MQGPLTASVAVWPRDCVGSASAAVTQLAFSRASSRPGRWRLVLYISVGILAFGGLWTSPVNMLP